MKALAYYAAVVFVVLAAVAAAPNSPSGYTSQESVAPRTDQAVKAAPTAVAASDFSPIYPLWNDDGSVTITLLDDGTVMIVVRIGGDPPSDDPERREPLATYVFFVKPDDLNLVCQGGEYFLVRGGAALKSHNVLPQQASLIKLDQPRPEQSGDSQDTIVRDWRGHLVLDWLAGANYGHLRVTDSAQMTAFEIEFTMGPQQTPGAPGWGPCGCRITCGIQARCSRLCLRCL
jgi:hypothetical protein